MQDAKNEKVTPTNQVCNVQIIKMAAFSFAIVSWVATAEGLINYKVFEYSWQSYLISFAIQSILLVFNLKLPFYFSQIDEPIKWKRKLFKGTLISLYVLLIMTSSFFSYVYISNTVYEKTFYLDASAELDHTYRTTLYDTEDFVIEYKKYIAASNNKKEDYIENLDEKITREEEKKKELMDQRENINENLNNLYNLLYNGKIYYEDYDDNASDLNEELKSVTKSLETVNENLKKYRNFAEKEQNSGYIELDIVEAEIKTMLKDRRNEEALIEIPRSYSDKKRIESWEKYWLDNFNTLEIALKKLPSYVLTEEETSTKGETSTEEETSTEGETSTEDNSTINKNLIKNYDANEKLKEIALLKRNYLVEINPIEKANNFLFSNFNFLAGFSFCFAILLDLFSLMAGIFLFSIKKKEIIE